MRFSRPEFLRLGFLRLGFLRLTFLGLTFAFLTLAVAASVAQTSRPPQSIAFSTTTYEAPAFLATFPASDQDTVKYSSENIAVKGGKTTTLNNYTLSLHNDSDAFLVLYCDIPNVRSDAAAIDQMLDGALTQFDNAKPTPKIDSTYSGLPARMVTATGTYTREEHVFQITAYQRIAVQGSRVWQGIVICDKTTACSAEDANKFLDSIKIR
jgi:hypothetical protein